MDTSKDILIALAKERYANEENGSHKRKDFEKDFRPEDFKIYVKTEDELISSLGKREKTRLGNLQRIGKFCNIYQPVTSNYFKTYENGKPHPVSIFPISCLNKHLVRLFGYPKKVSRLLHICQDIGFLVRVSDKYRFNCSCKEKNFCYLYAYNKYVEHLIIDVCRKRKIDIETTEDIFSILDKLKDGTNITPEDYERITLNALHIGSVDCSDEKAKGVIAQKYWKLIEPRQAKINEMNQTLPSEQRIKFDPNVKHGDVTKKHKKNIITTIGLRATSKIVSFKEHENGNEDYRGIWRWEYLRQYFNCHPYISYDVKASIYQISHLLNFGEWLGNGYDPYQFMFGGQFKDALDRTAYKMLCMCIYFNYPKRVVGNNRFKIPNCLAVYGYDTLKESIIEADKGMVSFTGRKFYNEVFLHESLLYIDFVYELRQRGIEVVQVYDGFYMREGAMSNEELERLMRQCAMRYYADYRTWLIESESQVDDKIAA